MSEEQKLRAAHIIIGEASEALFYSADSITRANLIDKLNALLITEAGRLRKAAIIKAIEILG